MPSPVRAGGIAVFCLCSSQYLFPRRFGSFLSLYTLCGRQHTSRSTGSGCDWIVTAFAIVILWCRLKDLGRDQFNAAQIDGVGLFAFLHVAFLPLVSRTFGLFAVLTLLTLAVSFFSRTLEVQSAEQLEFYVPNAQLLVTCSDAGQSAALCDFPYRKEGVRGFDLTCRGRDDLDIDDDFVADHRNTFEAAAELRSKFATAQWRCCHFPSRRLFVLISALLRGA